MSGIILLSNPNSRQNRKNPALLDRLMAMADGRIQCINTPDLEALEKAAQEIHQADPAVILINGGDGTNSFTLTALAHAYGDKKLPKIALLRGGTMNTVATGLGISGNPKSILKSVLKQYENGSWNLLQADTLDVGGKHGFLFGTGLMAGFLEAYYASGNPSPWTAVKTLASVVGSAAVQGPLIKKISEKKPIELIVDGQSRGVQTYDIVGAGTSPSLAFFFRPFYRALESSGTFHLWAVQCGPWQLSLKLPAVALAKAPNHPQIHEDLIQDLVLQSEEAFSFQLDGEVHQHQGGPLHVKPGRALEIILP